MPGRQPSLSRIIRARLTTSSPPSGERHAAPETRSRAEPSTGLPLTICRRQRRLSASLTDDCNKLISAYSVYYPQKAEAFMYDVVDGQSYTVNCGGMRATTTVSRSSFELRLDIHNDLMMIATAFAVAFIVYSCKGKLSEAEHLKSFGHSCPDG